jgi:hypothetical protein
MDVEYGTCYVKKPDGTSVAVRIGKGGRALELRGLCKDALYAGDGVVALLTRNATLNMLVSSVTGAVTTLSTVSQDVFWDRAFFAAGSLYSVIPFSESSGISTYVRGDPAAHRYTGYLVRTSLSIPPTSEVLTPAEQYVSTVQAATAGGDIVYSWRANISRKPDDDGNAMWWSILTRSGVTLNLTKLARAYATGISLSVTTTNSLYIPVKLALSPRANELVLAVGVDKNNGNIHLIRATVNNAGDGLDFGYLGALISNTTAPLSTSNKFDIMKFDNVNGGGAYMSSDRNALYVVLFANNTMRYDIWRVDISLSASASSKTTSVGSSIFGGMRNLTPPNTIFPVPFVFSGVSGDFALVIAKAANPNYAANPKLPAYCIVSADLVKLSTATVQANAFTVTVAEQNEACTYNARVSEDGRLVFYFRVFPAAPRTRQWYRRELATGATSGPQLTRFDDDQTSGIKL